MEHTLTEGSLFKKLLLFTVPIFGANLLHAMYGTVDLMVVGLFSDAASVSAVSTGSMTMQTLSSIVIGLTMGSTVLLGQSIGRKDEKAAARAVGSSLWLFIVLGLILTVVMVLWFMSKIPGVSLFQVGFATPLASAFGIVLTGVYLWRFEKKRTKRFRV